jgi:DNA-binding response OmpR family regulator
VLVIEDDPPTYRALFDGLQRHGLSVLEAHDGADGLAFALSHRPDVIVLDLLMPRMDGFQMLEKLRMENKWGKNVPVIIFTVVDPAEKQVSDRVAELQPTYYLEKSSLSIDDLYEKIMSIIEVHHE